MRSVARDIRDHRPGIGGRLFIALFALVFSAASVGLVAFAWRESSVVFRERTIHEEVPGIVVASEVVRGEGDRRPYEARVVYRFELRGRTHEASGRSGASLFRNPGYTSHEEAQAVVSHHPVGSPVTVLVDPDDPQTAHIQPTPIWGAIFSGVFALVFGGFSLLLVVIAGSMWQAPKADDASRLPEGVLARRVPRTWGRVGTSLGFLGAAVFCSVFVFAAAYLAREQVLTPRARAQAAGAWQATSCTIESVDLVDDGDDGERLDVLYRYEVDGRVYHASRYDFFDHARDDAERRQLYFRVRDRSGETVACYVNPANPRDAVIDRAVAPLDRGVLLLVAGIGLFGLLFVIGFLRAAWAAARGAPERGAETPMARVARAARPADVSAAHARAEVLLGDVRARRKARLVFGIVATVFLASFTGLWLHPIARGGGGLAAIFLGLTGIPLVVLTLGALVMTVGAWRALALPLPRVTLPKSARPGEDVTMTWALEGALDHVQDVRFTLEMHEEINLGSESGPVQKAVVERLQVAERAGFWGSSTEGQERVRVPAHAMVTCSGEEWRVSWLVQVDLTLRDGRSLRESFALAVVAAGEPA